MGREVSPQQLNEAVAVEVMGELKPHTDPVMAWRDGHKYKLWEPSGLDWIPVNFHTGNGMLLVIERMRELGWDYSLQPHRDGHDARFRRADGFGRSYFAIDPDLPTAVLTAALEAVRGEGEA